MSHLATAAVTSAAEPDAFFARWGDMATWPEWNLDTEWVRLDGPFVEGATGTLKPKGGPRVRFVVERLTDTEFVDTSKLFGARLTFRHRVSGTGGTTDVRVDVSIRGPLALVWRVILGRGIKQSVQPDLERLAAAAESLEQL
jgi:Polyketide cyclase / dehydrase and lipid transport